MKGCAPHEALLTSPEKFKIFVRLRLKDEPHGLAFEHETALLLGFEPSFHFLVACFAPSLSENKEDGAR